MKILVIDDSAPFRRALTALLGHGDFGEVVAVETAREGMDVLSASTSKPPKDGFGVVLMDVMMPQMDGIEAVREIKRRPELRDLPILMVSAQGDEERVRRAFDAGAIDFISKPIKKFELQARVKAALRLKVEMDRRKRRELELEQTVAELKKALDEVDTLTGLLPICSYCKKIRDDSGYWTQVEAYIEKRSDARFSHSICPACFDAEFGALRGPGRSGIDDEDAETKK